jgi:hypothetical protein
LPTPFSTNPQGTIRKDFVVDGGRVSIRIRREVAVKNAEHAFVNKRDPLLIPIIPIDTGLLTRALVRIDRDHIHAIYRSAKVKRRTAGRIG